MEKIVVAYPDNEKVTLEGYILNKELHFGQSLKRPTVIVCAGGGYQYRCDREAEPIALAYAARGFTTFVLNYSVKEEAHDFAPYKELNWAIGYVRDHAEELMVDENAIATCGFSAGGHLALAGGLVCENKPNYMILGYPAVFAVPDAVIKQIGERMFGLANPSEEDIKKIRLIDYINENSPAAFIFGTAQDQFVQDGPLQLALEYNKHKLPYEIHIYGHGPHGMALGTVASADGSSRNVNERYETWVDLSVKWLMAMMGTIELKDVSTSKLGIN